MHDPAETTQATDDAARDDQVQTGYAHTAAAPKAPLLLEESTANEVTIATWRLIFCLVAAVQVVLRVAFSPAVGYDDWVLLICVFVGVFYSATLFVFISRQGYSPIVSFVSVTLDVSLITAGLLGVAMSGQYLFATNSPVSAPLYILAIALAGLRYNPRLTVFATALAMFEYAGLVWFCVRYGDLSRDMIVYGQFNLVMQLTNLILIASGGVVSTFGVRRARELRTASILDALTQVYNRGFFDERYEHEFSRAERYHRPLSIAVFDIDHFKSYNDRYGHINGDQVLREVSDIFRLAARNTDTVARYGGEEFVVLLPETNKEQGIRFVERLRQQVERHSFLGAETQPGGALTISIGVAAFPGEGRTPRELFSHADQALYVAKSSGRNRVVGYTAPMSDHQPPPAAPPLPR